MARNGPGMAGAALLPQPLIMQPIFIESIYFVLIVAICLAIYFKTREIEKLSGYQGIIYFRLTFMFFSISYFFKFITSIQISAFSLTRSYQVLQILPTAGTLFISLYASLMAVIYLTNSVTWKKEEKKSSHEESFWHIVSIGAAALTVFMSQPMLYILTQVFLLFYSIMELSKHHEKKSSFIKTLYPAMMLFWMLSIVDIFIPNLLYMLQLLIYLVSSGLFLIILNKVFNRVGKGLK